MYDFNVCHFNLIQPKRPLFLNLLSSSSSSTVAKMPTSKPEFQQNSFRIKQDDKFFSRLLSKESSAGSTSVRVYYGGVSGAVPFLWESQPGTPKHTLSENSLPPLTPPPSYYSTSHIKTTKRNSQRPNLLFTLFSKPTYKKNQKSSPPSLSLTSSSSSSSSWSWSSLHSPMSASRNSNFQVRTRFSSSTISSLDDEEELALGSLTSTLRFSNRSEGSAGRFRGCSSVVILKRALFSIVGNGSA